MGRENYRTHRNVVFRFYNNNFTLNRRISHTCVKKNTAYAKSHTEQVYAITLPMDTLGELTVNSLQKLE